MNEQRHAAIAQLSQDIVEQWQEGMSVASGEIMEAITEYAVRGYLEQLVADGQVIRVPAVEGPHGTDRLELFVPTDVAATADEFNRRVALAVEVGAVTDDGAVVLATGQCTWEGGPTSSDWAAYEAALAAEGLTPPRRRHSTRCGCTDLGQPVHDR